MVDCVCEELQCQYDDQQRGLMEGHRRRVERAPKGIEFRVSHRKARTFKCAKLDSRTPLTFMFENDKGGQSNIKDYFQVGYCAAQQSLFDTFRVWECRALVGVRCGLCYFVRSLFSQNIKLSTYAQHCSLPVCIV